MIYVVLTFLLLGAVLYFFTIPLIISAAKRQLQGTFPASTVSIEKCYFSPKGTLEFSGISIKREGVYSLAIKEINIKYKIPQVFMGSIDGVRIVEPSLTVNSRLSVAEKLKEMINIETSGESFFSVNGVDVSGANVNVTTSDLDFEGVFSVSFSLLEKIPRSIDAEFKRINVDDITFDEVRVKSDAHPSTGAVLSVKKIIYNKAVIKDMTGVMRFDGAVLSIDAIKAGLFNGMIKGEIEVTFDGNRKFSMNLTCQDLDLDTLVKDFDLDEKVHLTGSISGGLSADGRNFELDNIQGALKTGTDGGVLVVKDPVVIEKLSAQTGQKGQALEVAVESLKNYVYNTGTMKLSLDKSEVIMNIEMEGDAGKRAFDIVVHDIVR